MRQVAELSCVLASVVGCFQTSVAVQELVVAGRR